MIVLGIGEYGATSLPHESIKTFGLGSCVAVICSDPASGIAGMAHIALPESAISPEKARDLPGYFADTGVQALFDSLRQVGWNAGSRLAIKLAGGAAVMDDKGAFNIGKRNVMAVKQLLRSMGLGTVAEDVGGAISRTVTVEAATGTVLIHTPGLPARTL